MLVVSIFPSALSVFHSIFLLSLSIWFIKKEHLHLNPILPKRVAYVSVYPLYVIFSHFAFGDFIDMKHK